ncbi:hypothetical protein CsatA_000659 [Cannabis sativa]
MASSSHYASRLADQYAEVHIDGEEEGILLEGEAEGEELVFDDRWCLVGKFLTGRSLDFDAMRHLMASLWQPGKGVYIKELETNLYLFQFNHELDIQSVIDGSPWTFNKVPLVFHRLRSGENPREIHIHKLDLLVQIHDLRSGFMMDKVVRSAGAYIGSFVKADPKNFNGIWRDYLRVRATIDIEKPLKRRMKLCKENGDWIWANFKYEHLPLFCFICGIIGHSERLCPKRFDQDFDPNVKPYGISMKAQMRRRNYQIGAQWLRTGNDDPEPASGGNVRRNEAEEQSTDITKIMDVDPMLSGSNGRGIINVEGNQGNKGADRVAGTLMGNITKNIHGDIVNPNNQELILVLENKKRRMDMGGIGGSVDVAADVEINVEMEKETGASVGPKNLLKVGLGSQAHQAL